MAQKADDTLATGWTREQNDEFVKAMAEEDTPPWEGAGGSEWEGPDLYHPTFLLVDTQDDVVVHWSEVESDLLKQVPHYLEAIEDETELAIYQMKSVVKWPGNGRADEGEKK